MNIKTEGARTPPVGFAERQVSRRIFKRRYFLTCERRLLFIFFSIYSAIWAIEPKAANAIHIKANM
jgi:hypothetical protein